VDIRIRDAIKAKNNKGCPYKTIPRTMGIAMSPLIKRSKVFSYAAKNIYYWKK
jgi:hypothetical protein